jgi:hypothetical protein
MMMMQHGVVGANKKAPTTPTLSLNQSSIHSSRIALTDNQVSSSSDNGVNSIDNHIVRGANPWETGNATINPQWFEVDLGSGLTVRAIWVCFHSIHTNLTAAQHEFKIFAKNNAGDDWTEILHHTGAMSAATLYKFDASADLNFRYYRFEFPVNYALLAVENNINSANRTGFYN